LTTYEQLTW